MALVNLMETIAQYIYNGLSHAEAAAKLGIEHGIEVSEAWLVRITGADGFVAAMDKVIATNAERLLAEKNAATAAVQAQAAAQQAAAAAQASQPIPPTE